MCESACTDMFLGGNNRYLVSDDGKLGYHAASVTEEYMAEVDNIGNIRTWSILWCSVKYILGYST